MEKKFKDIKKAGLAGIFGNIFLLIIKGTIGIITHSQSMIADSVNSASDIVASLMTFIGNKIASEPQDKSHNFGHGKAEYIFSMLISLTMIVLSIKMIYSSIKSLFVPYSYHFSAYLIIVCVVTIIIKVSLFCYTNSLAKKYDNLLVAANSKDHIYDCILTSLNLVASIFGAYGITFIDGIVGSIVGAWIFAVAIKLFKESFDVLMDKGMNDELKNKVIKIVKNHPEIKNINHFNSTPIGYRYQVSLTIFVDGNMTTFESHNIANNLEKEISKPMKGVACKNVSCFTKGSPRGFGRATGLKSSGCF